MDKYKPYELAQMQQVPLEGKILMTMQRIRARYDYWDGQVYVSFSGGKDSTVLKHIVESMYDDVPSVFVNTGLEYPEIQKFAIFGYPIISKEGLGIGKILDIIGVKY